MRRASALLAVAAVLCLVACTPQPPVQTNADRIWQTYGEALSIAVDTYSEAMLSAGAAHARGQITAEQLENVRRVGGQTKAALDAAKASLLVYASAQDPQPQAIALTVAQAQQAVFALLQLLTSLGVSL